MSDKENQDLPDSEPSDIQRVAETCNKDWFLQEMINLANVGAELDITINVGGVLASGTLIGGQKYFEMLAESINFSNEGNPDNETVKKFFSGFGDMYQEAPPVDSIGYIHMKDIKFHALSGTPVPSNSTIWRGRLSQVNGFILGRPSG
ncbi:hypothetical protein BZG04_03360 [Salinivibrio kushneri]|uniref:gas vesicle accessory protein GvpU n=1 Tax=Salinivibrio kushneri TaxID=1908198 RepID=UPI00098956D7|nr:gas vesicle accessory protein GvpU [Salinivibrio kushneri]OOE37463.1 hypothetical protein BZG04_03360 [Salinivibrio kushneri]